MAGAVAEAKAAGTVEQVALVHAVAAVEAVEAVEAVVVVEAEIVTRVIAPIAKLTAILLTHAESGNALWKEETARKRLAHLLPVRAPSSPQSQFRLVQTSRSIVESEESHCYSSSCDEQRLRSLLTSVSNRSG